MLKETYDERDAHKQPTKHRLSTITTKESLVDSQEVSGLQVRGYNSELKIPIPVAYTSTSIPADEAHIPTTTTAKNWSHLRPIEDKMLDLLDCNMLVRLASQMTALMHLTQEKLFLVRVTRRMLSMQISDGA